MSRNEHASRYDIFKKRCWLLENLTGVAMCLELPYVGEEVCSPLSGTILRSYREKSLDFGCGLSPRTVVAAPQPSPSFSSCSSRSPCLSQACQSSRSVVLLESSRSAIQSRLMTRSKKLPKCVGGDSQTTAGDSGHVVPYNIQEITTKLSPGPIG